jgi:hypothetical protein
MVAQLEAAGKVTVDPEESAEPQINIVATGTACGCDGTPCLSRGCPNKRGVVLEYVTRAGIEPETVTPALDPPGTAPHARPTSTQLRLFR